MKKPINILVVVEDDEFGETKLSEQVKEILREALHFYSGKGFDIHAVDKNEAALAKRIVIAE